MTVTTLKTGFLAIGALISLSIFGQDYKRMMKDHSVNYYTVIKEAEKYFDTHDKGKGSGYKGYLRWKFENEGKYFPSGDRDKVSPFFVEQAYQKLRATSAYNTGARATQNSWEELGPWDANNVTSHYSQGIGRVETFHVDANNTDIIYLGSRSGGFWRTTDGGKNWVCSTDTLVATGVRTLSASVTNPDSVVIDVANANNGYSQGVFYSTDGGLTWTISAFNPSNLGWGGLGRTGRVNVVAVSPFDSKVVLIGTDRGLYRSTDFLQTYSLIQGGTSYTQVVFHPTDANKVYAHAGNSRNIRVSNDGGQTFTNGGNITGTVRNGRLSVSGACNTCIYFSTNNGVWKSINEGQSFTYLSNPNQNGNGFAVSDIDTSRMVYGYVDLTASSDGGRNFVQRTWWSTGNNNHTGSSYIHADLRVAKSINGVFYVGTDGYLAKSTDGGVSWDYLNDGTAIREFYRFGLSQSDQDVSMAGSQDNGTSVYTSNGWIEWNGGDGMEAVVHPINSDWMIGSWQYGNRQRTKDGGQSRHGVAHGGSNYWIAPMLIDPNHQMTVFAFGGQVYKSEEFGGNWQNLGTSLVGQVKHAAIAYNNSNNIIIVNNNVVALSTNGGNTFTNITSQMPFQAAISAIAFDPKDDQTVVFTYDRYNDDNRRVYISRDLCKTWENISYNLSAMPLRTIAIDYSDSSYIYVGGERGVYYKSKDAKSWKLYSKDLPNVSVRELDIQWATNTLRAVTWGRGMWQTKLVGRENYPTIPNIWMTETPTEIEPKEDLPIDITAIVKSTSTLESVYVLWSKDSATWSNRIDMERIQGDTFRTKTAIPEFPAGTEMYFKVFAKDESGDLTESYKLNYAYRVCNVRPTVTANTTHSQLCRGDQFTLSANGAQRYQWTHDVQANQSITAFQTTTYEVTGWDANNCAGKATVSVMVDTVDTRVTIGGSDLESQAQIASYQWLDCEQGYSIIPQATQAKYSNTAGGEFAVEVLQNGCSDTSKCYRISPLYVNGHGEKGISIYPNPIRDRLVVDFAGEKEEIVIEVRSSDGALSNKMKLHGQSQVTVDMSNQAKGVYFIHVFLSGKPAVFKVTKME